MTLFDFLSLKNDVNVISSKNCVKNEFFAGMLKVNDENSRIRIPDPDPLVRSMDQTQNVIDPEHWLDVLLLFFFGGGGGGGGGFSYSLKALH